MDFEKITWYSNKITDIIKDLPAPFAVDSYNRRQHMQMDKIDRILRRENVRTVYQEEYVDRHFIPDFCGHYGSCFQDYPKKCIRLHFFTKEFALKQFIDMLEDPKQACDWKKYLGDYVGFIVLRPIPQAVLGNVSLKAPSDDAYSHYLRKNIISHLCGLDLEVQTIPFQEQDDAISACATAALWMALHAIPGKDPYNVPSPHKLTSNAQKVLEEGIIPHKITKGLTISQMAQAIKEEGLAPLVCVPHSTSYAKALIRAYSSANIPIVLGIELYFRSSNRVIGNHAVTVLGWKKGSELKEFDAPDLANDYHYRTEESNEGRADSEKLYSQLFLESSKINGLYCHDDQIGPYSLISIPDEYSFGLTKEWILQNNESVDATIVSVLVPCSPKVRIHFSYIYEIVKALNSMLYLPYYYRLGCKLTWDIRLETVCNFRKTILAGNYGYRKENTKFKVLSTPFPRFIWVVDQYIQEKEEEDIDKEKVVSFIFDATDIQNSDFTINVIHSNEKVYTANRTILKKKYTPETLASVPPVVRHLLKHYKQDDNKII